MEGLPTGCGLIADELRRSIAQTQSATRPASRGLFVGPATRRLLFLVLRLVVRRTRAETPVAFVGEAIVAAAPIRVRGLVGGRARTLAAIAIVGHAGRPPVRASLRSDRGAGEQAARSGGYDRAGGGEGCKSEPCANGRHGGPHEVERESFNREPFTPEIRTYPESHQEESLSPASEASLPCTRVQ